VSLNLGRSVSNDARPPYFEIFETDSADT